MASESERLRAAREEGVAWRRWGPYLSERQWGTVREDYSADGNAWGYFPHDHARSRAYRWGEDGLGGISDDRQLLCFALVLWNGADPILKERLFGLSGPEGNHGEDVKEYYFYLDATPTHSYMKYLYRYPQAAFPYADLVDTAGARGYADPEYELLDTGVFDEDRYFDVQLEYAKADTDDILIQVSISNRGPEAAALRVLPTLWFRNTWSWSEGAARPLLKRVDGAVEESVVLAAHPELGEHVLHCLGAPQLLFTENETHAERLFGSPNSGPHVKDGINDYVVAGRKEAVNPDSSGTKVAADYALMVDPGATEVVRLRLARPGAADSKRFGKDFDRHLSARQQEADEFYDALAPASLTPDERAVMRQALAGMLWSKQYYEYDVEVWMRGDRGPDGVTRNRDWAHLKNHDVVSMPDKWEYPWYAAWDLAFHCVPLSYVDVDFAKEQLALFLEDRYQHPNGQIPAYEWNFGDVNPPVHAWAVIRVYLLDKERSDGRGDIAFLKRAFEKLRRNFDWWVDYKDPTGRNVFEGGFLGLDNIGVFDRSAALPTGGRLEQSDGTAWMAFYAQNMLQIALELARHDPAHEEDVLEYLDRFVSIAGAMDRAGENESDIWDEEDGFFYDVLCLPDGSATRLKVRSLVGLMPLCAATVFDPDDFEKLPRLRQRCDRLVAEKADLARNISPPDQPGLEGRLLLAVCGDEKLRRLLSRLLDESEFLGPYGIRSLSRFHAENPYVFHWEGEEYRVGYQPGESDSDMFGGNSNWRGPVWFPSNVLILRSLIRLYAYYGDDFQVECPTGSGQERNLYQVAEEIARRLVRIFVRDGEGRRPVYGGAEKFQSDPFWRDHILFYEYFHGDDGAGMGASHQTGWTGSVAVLLALFESLTAEDVLEQGASGVIEALAEPVSRGEAEEAPASGRAGFVDLAAEAPRHPTLYQINTRVWLTDLSARLGRPVTLDDVPDDELDALASLGFDWVYLLGVWQTGAAGREVSRSNPEWRREYEALLDDLDEEDICGSCFAVTGYSVHAALGGDDALLRLRDRLHARGLRLMLDFVPNHTAPDHPWVREKPDFYVAGSEADLEREPRNYRGVDAPEGRRILAHGRDPYFPGWPDTLQLDYGMPELQEAMRGELLRAARLCDGLRCDMAMLVLPEVFGRTWGIEARPFWPDAIQRVRQEKPGFVLMAEVYWDMEWTLQQQGFDYTYDKRLYDRLRDQQAGPAREHFRADADYQDRSARFLENHDEPRAAATFPGPVQRAAALLTYLCPGLRFFHQGQMQGWQRRIPVHLCRGPEQPTDPSIQEFHRQLLELLRHPALRDGDWRLLDCTAVSADDPSSDGIIAFAWDGGEDERLLVVVNYASEPGRGRIAMPFPELAGRLIRLEGRLGGASYERDGDALLADGLSVELGPWSDHVFEMVAAEREDTDD